MLAKDLLMLFYEVFDATPKNYRTEYIRVFLLDINEMERNDLWLNVKGNYILFIGQILLNLD